jgi:hypothetical protein
MNSNHLPNNVSGSRNVNVVEMRSKEGIKNYKDSHK